MTNLIDWEKQYASLELQMKEMMKKTLKLLDENSLTIQDIIIEKQNAQKFITVIFNGETPYFKYECYDDKNKLIFTEENTFRNSLNITNLERLDKIYIYIKEKNKTDYLYKKEIHI